MFLRAGGGGLHVWSIPMHPKVELVKVREAMLVRAPKEAVLL